MVESTLDTWILSRIDPEQREKKLSRKMVTAYQLRRIRAAVDYVKARSPFYRRHVNAISGGDIASMSDVGALPFTAPEDLRDNGLQFLCVSQDEIQRIISLETSGTTGKSKRVYFTRDDLERTIDFFHHGIAMLMQAGQKALIMLPGGERENGAADLLKQGMARAGVRAIVHRAPADPESVVALILGKKIHALVGIPAEVLALIRSGTAVYRLQEYLTLVILCSDYVPAAIVREVESRWRCPVVSHYGTTEMGLAGGVECLFRRGYHVRESDLYLEIIDPTTGTPVKDGETGEVVFTTLARTGMPFIRYQTGDAARFIPTPCECGTVLKTVEKVRGRVAESVKLGVADVLCITDLDEALFSVSGVIQYRAQLERTGESARLLLSVHGRSLQPDQLSAMVKQRVVKIPTISRAIANGNLEVDAVHLSDYRVPAENEKRKIKIQENSEEDCRSGGDGNVPSHYF